ncbi:MAG: protein kinase, partial [Elusimicrobia bacterium]|nr:protein kinase [Elusimicrobiota bacterium]
ALNNRAISFYQLGRYPEAVQDATRVSELEPKSERAYTTRALANYQMRNYASALEDARLALSLNPNNQLAFQISKLSETRVTKSSSLGLDAAQKAAADKIAREYENLMEQRSQAETAAAAPKPVEQKAPEASAAAQPPPSRREKFTDSLNQKALNQVRIGDPKAAIQYASKALDRDPDNAQSHSIMARAQNMMGLYQEAFEEATQSLNLNPDNAQSLDIRAAALIGLGRFDAAIADAQRAIELNGKNAFAYRHRGQGHEGLGDLKAMIADYKKAAELNPEFQSAYEEARQKYRVAMEPSPAPGPVQPPQRRPAGRRFLIVLLCSLTGGFLISMGLLHIVSGRKASATGAQGKTTSPRAFEASYQIVRTIGQGGMGVVYEAVDKALNRKVAIKKMRDELKADEHERGRFLREARTVAAMHHPNIVDIHTILETNGDLYLVFEYVKGRTLDQILAKKKRLNLTEAQYIARGVMSALAYAHQQGVVHRDLKPSNIMVTEDGWVKVMDFGIARHAKDTLHRFTGTNVAIGTPLYMAPEQEQGDVRPESDLYAFGACLYEMLTGQRPFEGSSTTAAKLAKSYKRATLLVGTLPPAVDALIDAALEPDPDKRIRTPAEFRSRIDALGHQQAKA